MSEARAEILRMVADKVITVEEAERLLRAIDEGERKSAGSDRQPGGRGPFGDVTSSLESIAGALSGLGPMVRDVVEEAFGGLSGVVDDDDDEGAGSSEVSGGRFALPPGSLLVIRSGHRSAAGELRIEGIDGETCEVVPDHPRSIHVLKGPSRTSIRWAGGPLTVRVPSTVAKVKATTLQGDVRADAIGCALAVHTMGGELSLTRVAHPFDAKTMGGSIRIGLAPSFQGEAQAGAMGADIELELPPELRGQIKATTFGGKIDIEPELGRVDHRGSPGKDRVILTIGGVPNPTGNVSEASPYRAAAQAQTDGAAGASITLKTMGGQVRIRRAAHG